VAASPAAEKIIVTVGSAHTFSTNASTTKISSKWIPRKSARWKLV